MTRNVVFVAPFPAEATLRFIRAAAHLEGVRLLGVMHTPPPDADRHLFRDLVRVEDPMSTEDLARAVGELVRRHGKPHRIIGILEAIQVQLGELRRRFGVEGTGPEVAALFRDKDAMKVALAKAGLPVARHQLLDGAEAGRAFAARVGFPIVLKPPAGMGAKSTFRVRSVIELEQALAGMRASPERPVLAEELIQGREFSFETITVGGKARMTSFSHYLPTCLDVLENPWIQWCCMLPRDVSGPEYREAREMGLAAIEALGLEDGVTHMEWFQRGDGSLAIGEIAQRPPGANISLMTGVAHDRDLYRGWARAVVDRAFDGPWERRHAVGCAFLRGMGHGRVARVDGLHEVHRAVGRWVVEAKLPTIGAPKSDSYEGDGYVVVRDDSTDVVKKLLSKIIDTVRVHYAGG